MTKEIDQLRQIQGRRDAFSALANKRERQYGQLTQNLGQESIERDIRIGEVMERTLGRWQGLTETSENLGHVLSEETAKINSQLERLRQLSANNPAISPVVERYEEELRSLGVLEEAIVPPPQAEEPKVPEKITQPQKISVEHEIRLPNGAVITTRSQKVAKLLEDLISGNKTLSGMASEHYGINTSETRSHVTAMMARIKPKLKNTGWKIVNVGEPNAAEYSLTPLEEVEKVEAQEKKIKKEKEVEGEEVELISGQIIFLTGGNQIRLLRHLDQGVSSIEDLAELMYGESNSVTRPRISAQIANLNKKLPSSGINIVNLTTKEANVAGVPARYVIRPIEEEEQKDQIPQAPETTQQLELKEAAEKRAYLKESIIPDFYEKGARTVTLPNGQTVEVESAWPYYLSQFISEGTNSVGEIAERVFGEDNHKNRGRASAAISGSNKTIKDTGFSFVNVTPRAESIKGVPAKYEWQDENGNIVISRMTEHEPASLPTIQKPAEVIEIPYTPTEEEIRTAEETRVVVAITGLLKKSSVIDFATLQRALRTDDRIRTIHRQRHYRPYQAEELKNLFESGLKKLREESIAQNLKREWTEADIKVWEEIESLANRFGGNDFDELVRQVKILLDRASKSFYGDFGGKAIEWLKLPPENGVY